MAKVKAKVETFIPSKV